MTPADPAAVGTLTPHRWRAFSVLALVQLMLILDTTVVNVALPSIRDGLQFSAVGMAWVVNGYALAAGGLLVLGGRLGDLLGRRRVFLAGVTIFALASLACGVAAAPWQRWWAGSRKEPVQRWPPPPHWPWSHYCSQRDRTGFGPCPGGAGWPASAERPASCFPGC